MSPAIRDLRSRLRGVRGILVDSNILLDVATADPVWAAWSEQALIDAGELTVLTINPVVYAEVSVNYASIEALNSALPESLYRRETLPWEAGFLAGKAFLQYRRRGGVRLSLPDFYIGAHAATGGLAVLTRDSALTFRL